MSTPPTLFKSMAHFTFRLRVIRIWVSVMLGVKAYELPKKRYGVNGVLPSGARMVDNGGGFFGEEEASSLPSSKGVCGVLLAFPEPLNDSSVL